MRIPNPPRLTVIHPAGQGAAVQPGHHGRDRMGRPRPPLTWSAPMQWPRAPTSCWLRPRSTRPKGLPAFRRSKGGEIRHRPPPRRRDLAEFRRHRADLSEQALDPEPPWGLRRCRGARRDGAGGVRRPGRFGRQIDDAIRIRLLHPPDGGLAGERSTRDGRRGDLRGRGRAKPDSVWNTTTEFSGPAASGGGVSTVFPRPSWQSGAASVVGAPRVAGCRDGGLPTRIRRWST